MRGEGGSGREEVKVYIQIIHKLTEYVGNIPLLVLVVPSDSVINNH